MIQISKFSTFLSVLVWQFLDFIWNYFIYLALFARINFDVLEEFLDPTTEASQLFNEGKSYTFDNVVPNL